MYSGRAEKQNVSDVGHLKSNYIIPPAINRCSLREYVKVNNILHLNLQVLWILVILGPLYVVHTQPIANGYGTIHQDPYPIGVLALLDA